MCVCVCVGGCVESPYVVRQNYLGTACVCVCVCVWPHHLWVRPTELPLVLLLVLLVLSSYLLSAMKCHCQLALIGYILTGCYTNSRSSPKWVVPLPAQYLVVRQAVRWYKLLHASPSFSVGRRQLP